MNNPDELKGLKRISEVSFGTSLIITPLSIIFSMITGSVTLMIYFIWAAIAIAVKIFALISIRIMTKENQFMFPNGTGKLENFSSFFFGVSIVPLGAYYLVASIIRLFSPLPGVTYLLCQVPVALSLLLTLMLIIWTNRIISQSSNPSPLLKAYFINFKVSITSDSFLFLAFFLGYLLSVFGFNFLSVRVDPVLSVILSLYMIRVGLPLIISNFRSLIDLPLPEKDMLKILKVTTEFYKEYSGFGLMFSRQSGKQKFIEVELLFDPGISLEKIGQVEQNMSSRIEQEIPDVKFRLIPKAEVYSAE
ncbi:MAG: cation transporter [Bacteroidota bacterium]